MADLLDLLTSHAGEVFSGTYYDKLPQTAKDAGEWFEYRHVDPNSRTYQLVSGGIAVTNARTTTIRTCDPAPFRVGGMCVLQDGIMYTIVALASQPSRMGEAYRMLSVAAGAETILRLSQVDNPWGIS